MALDKINPAAAAGAYANIQKTGAVAGTSNGDQTDFMGMVRKATTDAIDTMHAGEKASASAVAGKADLTDVVQAVTDAQNTLETVVALRDRMLGAYQDLMRTQI